MISALLLFLASTPLSTLAQQEPPLPKNYLLHSKLSVALPPLEDIKIMLQQQAPSLNELAINKVLTSLKCASSSNLSSSPILTIIDYSLPSNQKRLWVFDLSQRKMLFNTYVSHGIKSGTLLTDYFSNKNNSKASSLGIYKTKQAYYGREGLSLRLDGLDSHFNDNAANRSIVMHGGWYMNEQFIKQYGRPGRSWGCPALPLDQSRSIINAIKDNSMMVVYYPNQDWFTKSKFLTCDKMSAFAMNQVRIPLNSDVPVADNEQREDVFFANVSKGGEDRPILVMKADDYRQLFHITPPLGRMLRRQINHAEYIALSNRELQEVVSQNNGKALKNMLFVIPVLHMVRGYYETQMKVVDLGDIKEIRASSDAAAKTNNAVKNYTVLFNAKPPIQLQTTDRFIRWLGL